MDAISAGGARSPLVPPEGFTTSRFTTSRELDNNQRLLRKIGASRQSYGDNEDAEMMQSNLLALSARLSHLVLEREQFLAGHFLTWPGPTGKPASSAVIGSEGERISHRTC